MRNVAQNVALNGFNPTQSDEFSICYRLGRRNGVSDFVQPLEEKYVRNLMGLRE